MPKKTTLVLISLLILITPIIILHSDLLNSKSSVFQYEKAKVIAIKDETIQEDSLLPNVYLGSQQLTVKILSGTYKGEIYNIKNSLSRLYNVYAKENMTLIVRLQEQEGQLIDVVVFNYKRDHILFTLIALFFLLLLIFGRRQGLKSIISLLFTAVMVIFFMIPMFFKGYDPIISAIITVSITTITTFLLISDWGLKTLSAILGTLLGVIVAGIISYVAGNLAHLSGITSAEAEELIYIASDTSMKIQGLMFAAILIACLGAIMDVAMSIASAIFEMYRLDSQLSKKVLFNSGMNVGRDIMGTMSNTLILAFSGSSLNIIILIVAYQMPYHQLIHLDLISTEIIQSLAGSIGIVLTVPITAFISVLLLKLPSKNKITIL